MRAKRATLLNRLVHELPERYVVDAAWLTRLGLSASSIRDYVERGWLERVGSRLYRRPEPGDGGPVRWEIATLSLQTLLEVPVHVGGMTALELAGSRAEEHTSDLQSPIIISSAVFCLKK